MLLTNFSGRMVAKFNSWKLCISYLVWTLDEKSEAPIFTPGNFLLSIISFTGPTASTGNETYCRSDNCNTTVLVCELPLCSYAKIPNAEPVLLFAIKASACIITLLVKWKWTMCVMWSITHYLHVASLVLSRAHCFLQQFASSRIQLCLEAMCLHADSGFSVRQHKIFFKQIKSLVQFRGSEDVLHVC